MRRLGRRRALPILGVTILVVVVGSVASFTASASQQQESLRFALVLPDLNNPFISAQRDGAVAEAKKHRISLFVKGSNDGIVQVNAFNTYVGQRVDFIGINTIDGKAMGPAVKSANRADIPVISMQSAPASGELVTFIAPNNFKAGQAIGRAIAEWCRNINPCKLGIIQGSFADISGVAEHRGTLSVIKKHSNIEYVGGSPTQYDPAKALNVALDLLTAHPDLNYLYAWWDQGALAAVQAVKQKNRTGKVGISGFTGICQTIVEVIKGTIHHEAMYFPEIQGKLFIQKAREHLAGKKLPKITPGPFYSLTTRKARAILAGKMKPPKYPPVLASLRQAQRGC